MQEQKKNEMLKKGIFIGSAVASVVALSLSIYTAVNQSSLNDELSELKSLVVLNGDQVSMASDSLVNDQMLKDYIMENPTVIIRSLGKYRFSQEKKASVAKTERVGSFSDQLYHDSLDPVIGNPNGKHVVVEFIDNNCGYCKRLAPILEEFVRIDPEAKVIVKEFPIFTNQPTSRYSALVGVAISLHSPAKYALYHKQVMAEHRLSTDIVDGIAEKIGVPVYMLEEQLKVAEQQLQKTHTLGAQLEVRGTPTVFFNDERVNGGFTARELMNKF